MGNKYTVQCIILVFDSYKLFFEITGVKIRIAIEKLQMNLKSPMLFQFTCRLEFP